MKADDRILSAARKAKGCPFRGSTRVPQPWHLKASRALKTRLFGDRGFESFFLQRRVQCEPYFPIHLAPGPAGRRALQLRSFAAARQYLAFADMVGGGDDAFRFHPFDNPSCAVVADLKVALHKARRSLAFAAHHRDGLRI